MELGRLSHGLHIDTNMLIKIQNQLLVETFFFFIVHALYNISIYSTLVIKKFTNITLDWNYAAKIKKMSSSLKKSVLHTYDSTRKFTSLSNSRSIKEKNLKKKGTKKVFKSVMGKTTKTEDIFLSLRKKKKCTKGIGTMIVARQPKRVLAHL